MGMETTILSILFFYFKGRGFPFLADAFRGHGFLISQDHKNIARNAALVLANTVLRDGVRWSRCLPLQSTGIRYGFR
ncbi:hypothetical protein AB1K89_15545 [Sporosarcina sp. 179-K 8C2 HS]|uniref:hypothetical protein n=1 Tax=Sporosarcina sp. 179-K 8C2 HS TaxID=3142387 RepID=UPI0039A1EA19